MKVVLAFIVNDQCLTVGNEVSHQFHVYWQSFYKNLNQMLFIFTLQSKGNKQYSKMLERNGEFKPKG